MANPGFLFLEVNGIKIQGEPGSDIRLDRTESIRILEVNHLVDIESSRSLRVHHAIEITVAIDRATPKLYQAWTQNDPCEAHLKFFRPTAAGFEEHFYSIQLQGARIVGLDLSWPEPDSLQAAQISERVTIKIIYETIMWRFEDGQIEHEDSWSSRIDP